MSRWEAWHGTAGFKQRLVYYENENGYCLINWRNIIKKFILKSEILFPDFFSILDQPKRKEINGQNVQRMMIDAQMSNRSRRNRKKKKKEESTNSLNLHIKIELKFCLRHLAHSYIILQIHLIILIFLMNPKSNFYKKLKKLFINKQQDSYQNQNNYTNIHKLDIYSNLQAEKFCVKYLFHPPTFLQQAKFETINKQCNLINNNNIIDSIMLYEFGEYLVLNPPKQQWIQSRSQSVSNLGAHLFITQNNKNLKQKNRKKLRKIPKQNLLLAMKFY